MGNTWTNEWSKDGRHVLYVNGANRESLGRLDLVTGRAYVESADRASAVATEIARWVARNPEACDFVTGTPQAGSRPALDGEESWEDLALNRPGQIAENKIAEVRAELRRRSKRWAIADRAFGADGVAGRWILGVRGEKRIGRVLERMARKGDWRVLHSIPLPRGGDVDHLLIGTDGVIVVNSKCHPKAKITVTPRNIYVRTAPTDYIEQARKQAVEVKRLLNARLDFVVSPIGCVALFNGGPTQPGLESFGSPDDVIVATNWNLPRAVWDADEGLSPEQVDAVYEAARRSSTWV